MDSAIWKGRLDLDIYSEYDRQPLKNRICNPPHFLFHMATPCLQGIPTNFQLSAYFLGDMAKGVDAST
jgi:hypothetical protein